MATSERTTFTPTAAQAYDYALQQEAQGNLQAAFNTLSDLQQLYPNYADVSERLRVYRDYGYAYNGPSSFFKTGSVAPPANMPPANGSNYPVYRPVSNESSRTRMTQPLPRPRPKTRRRVTSLLILAVVLLLLAGAIALLVWTETSSQTPSFVAKDNTVTPGVAATPAEPPAFSVGPNPDSVNFQSTATAIAHNLYITPPAAPSLTPVSIRPTQPSVSPTAVKPATNPAQVTVPPLNQTGIKVFGPFSGQLFEQDQGMVATKQAEQSLRNGVFKAQFTNPVANNGIKWDYGFFFRQTKTKEYALIVGADGHWEFDLIDTSAGGTPNSIASGTLTNLSYGPNALNNLAVFVKDKTAAFWLNDKQIALLDVSANQEKGDIEIGAFFFKGDGVLGSSVVYQDFTVYSSDNS